MCVQSVLIYAANKHRLRRLALCLISGTATRFVQNFVPSPVPLQTVFESIIYRCVRFCEFKEATNNVLSYRILRIFTPSHSQSFVHSAPPPPPLAPRQNKLL
uniref:(northern house mosquito) hypothetical protein n=1 Tax=Culex pipiens TaxID=7175 RepID=A0A8D8GL87_CULPI